MTLRLSRLYEPIYSSFQIEVYAILDALSELTETLQPNGNCINVFTDSQSTLTHLRSLSLNPRPISRAACDLVRIINKAVREHDLKISFYWIPGHTGIKFNEEADRLAKSRLERRLQGDTNYVSIPRSRLKRINRELTKLQFDQYLRREVKDSHWNSYPPRRFYKKNRSAQPMLSRNLDVCLFRIRTGHNKLKAHLSNIGIEDSATCRFCKANGSREDCYHLLIQCKRFVCFEGGDEINVWRRNLRSHDREAFTNGFSLKT